MKRKRRPRELAVAVRLWTASALVCGSVALLSCSRPPPGRGAGEIAATSASDSSTVAANTNPDGVAANQQWGRAEVVFITQTIPNS